MKILNINCLPCEEYINASQCKFVGHSLQHSETFDVSHVFLPLTIAELSTLKQVRFFGPPSILSDSLQVTEILCDRLTAFAYYNSTEYTKWFKCVGLYMHTLRLRIIRLE